ncbi:MAG TPA: hypothetical protein VN676_11700 [Steroidobacteraceae bacterium]|jgi:hypothetical protein|nr:hypothetical protein [Steroidobacteraceae bacterium]
MNAKWVIWPVVVAALLALVVWIARNTYWEEMQLPQLPQGEAAVNPFYSAARLSELLGAKPTWQRVLAATPPSEGVLVVSQWNWGLFPTRRERVQRWVASGGRLVVDRTLIGGQKELQAWAGIDRYTFSSSELARFDRITKYEKCPTLTLHEGPETAPAARRQFQVCGVDRISGLRSSRRTLWALRDSNAVEQAVRVPVGLGSVTIVNSAPFGNQTLLEGDDAALFVAATQLRRGDSIWFVTEKRSASLLALVWKLAAPVVLLFVALIAAWLWRVSARFGPPLAPTELARRSLAEQIRGTGQFTLRFGGGRALYAAQVRALQEAAERRIPGYPRLGGTERVEALAQLAGIEANALAAALSLAAPRRPGELRQGLILLESIRRTLSIKPQHRERS